MALLQQDRLVTLNTPLGKDALLVSTVEGTEGISNLFRFNVVLVSEKRSIALADLVGQRVCIGFELADKKFRYINGFVSRFSQGDVDARVAHYYAEVVPWLWFLTRTSDCRIFQKMNVPDIIQKIFKDLGFTDFKLQLQGSFEPRDFCVQYRETDFAFVSRLMEEEGIFYFFEHGEDKHTLVIANNPGAHPDCPNQAEARYGYLLDGVQDKDMVSRWHTEQELRPGKVTLTDYYFQTPSNNLQVNAPSAVSVGGNGKFEIYDYPGSYAKRFDGDDKAGKVRPDGERTAKLAMQGEEAFHKTISGAGTCRAFTPGYRFELIEHRREDLNGPYVLTQVTHSATNNLGNDEGSTYDNTFSCIPHAVPFRPARTTPRPLMHGTQTAVVVGLGGEEIDTDKYGRVKVQFRWDREGKKDQNSSCWVRVATPWAGKQWGMVHIPRIGQEVIVDFLEGDPDQPIIIGSVYNAEQMPPYELPANKTQSGIVTRSSLKGTEEDFNEICFEDKKGEELLYIRAQKDQTIAVENIEAHWVGRDRLKTIDNNETTLVGNDRTETVGNNESISIHGHRSETVDKDETITIHGVRTEIVDKDETTTIHGNRTEEVDKDETITIHGNRTEKVDKDENITIAKNREEKVTENEAVSIGKNRSHSVKGNDSLEVGKNLSVTAKDQITLKTGDASITMKKDGTIIIKGKDITIDGSGKINIKAGGDMILKGSKIAEN
jgi:type VI secretion system secreted protein VgrG